MMTRGRVGSGYPPKMMTSFMNSPLSTPGTKSNTTGQGGVFVKKKEKQEKGYFVGIRKSKETGARGRRQCLLTPPSYFPENRYSVTLGHQYTFDKYKCGAGN